MVKNDLLIIHPNDESTRFLTEILYYLQEHTTAIIQSMRLESADDHLYFKKNVAVGIENSALIMFMGHGVSNALSGPSINGRDLGNLISGDELSMFTEKQILLLSCRSSEYLEMHGKKCGLKAGIGFPNLITESYELIGTEDPLDRIEGISEGDIAEFRKILVDIVKFSLADYLNYNLGFHQLFTRIQLRARKKLLAFYNETPNAGKLPLGKMLYDLNEGLYIIGN